MSFNWPAGGWVGGRVGMPPARRSGGDPKAFAHFTTYPMAMSPHFARILCRTLFVMWLALDSPAVFPVIELGGGSGQLASDLARRAYRGVGGQLLRGFEQSSSRASRRSVSEIC